MLKITSITIQNGTNTPNLYENRNIERHFNSEGEFKVYRERLKQLAMRRYKKEVICVYFSVHYLDERWQVDPNDEKGRKIIMIPLDN